MSTSNKHFTISLILAILWIHSSDSGSPCPQWEKIKPCFCTTLSNEQTVLVCSGIQNTSLLEEATMPLKSMIIDRFLLLNTFTDTSMISSENSIDAKTKTPETGMLPRKWLAEVRVRELEIQNGQLDGCFLCDEALEGQSDFLTSLVVKNANLRGHICSTCSLGSTPSSISTRELKKTPLLRSIDLSFNLIEVVDGNAFPSTLTNLTKITLSNNRISRIHDNAFATLHQLNEIDLSRNQLTSISRKIFRSPDIRIRTIDLSYNSIRTLPEDMFTSLSGLKQVTLSHNLLETLPSTTWTRLPSLLEKIDLRGNFLICNCTMSWIPRRLSKSTKLVGHCIGPREVEFQELKSNLPPLNDCQ